MANFKLCTLPSSQIAASGSPIGLIKNAITSKMNVRLVYVSTDHKGMISLGKTLGKFYASLFASSGVISPGRKDWRT
jgi:hypothetical protein